MITSEIHGFGDGRERVVELSDAGYGAAIEAADWGAHLTSIMITAVREGDVSVSSEIGDREALYGGVLIVRSVIRLMEELDVVETADKELLSAIDTWMGARMQAQCMALGRPS